MFSQWYGMFTGLFHVMLACDGGGVGIVVLVLVQSLRTLMRLQTFQVSLYFTSVVAKYYCPFGCFASQNVLQVDSDFSSLRVYLMAFINMCYIM